MYLGIKAKLFRPRECYKHVECRLTQKDLLGYVEKNWDHYMRLHREWRRDSFSRRLVPSLDRIDSTLHYSLDNIQIIPFHENARRAQKGIKKSKVHRRRIGRGVTKCFVTYRGELRSLVEWSKIVGVSYPVLYGRIHKCGWDVERAFNTPQL